MKNIYFLLFFVICGSSLFAQDVTEIWTNYDGFWNSSSTNINPVRPDNSHELLAFRYGANVFSTGVDDQKLDDNGVTYIPLNFRALPIASLPTSGSNSYFVGLGQLIDGLDAAVDNGPIIPFAPITNGTQVASFLTDGIQGLDLGTNIANIPGGTESRFNLSSAGITLNQIGDNQPDILVSQTAQPVNNNVDQLRFVDSSGNTVGSVVTLNISNEPVVGNWLPDFYNFNSTQTTTTFIKSPRPIHFFAVDLADFNINASNAANAVALIYRPGGTSDPSFIAFNEPSLGVAAQLSVVLQPTEQNCDGTLPIDIQVQLEDQNGFAVAQGGLAITASLETGPGDLIGTLTKTTAGNGVATFNDLEFTIGGNHIIRFDFAGLASGFTSLILDATGCSTIQWTGDTDTNWSVITNWSPQEIPDANNDVIIPNGRPNYPILDVDAGAKNLTMGSDASIDLNGFLFALNGNFDNVATGASINASSPGSELFMSAITAQNIPADFISEDVAKFTVENPSGVTLNSIMNITEVLSVRQGTLSSNDFITMVCTFSPRQTAQIDRLNGSITGNVVVEQCFPARRAFRLVSSSTSTTTSIRENWQEGASAWNDNPSPDPDISNPNTSGYGTHITGLGVQNTTPGAGDGTNGFDWQPSGNPSMFTFSNTPAQNWAPIDNTASTILNAGDPYRLMIRGDRSVDIRFNNSAPTNTKLRSTGSVAKGPITINLAIDNEDFALIGNPFHANVDMRKVLNSSTNLVQSFAVWDPTLGGTPTVGSPGGRGAFVTVNVTNNTSNNSSSEMTRFLQPYQAVLVYASGDSPSLTFLESDKAVEEDQLEVFTTLPTSFMKFLLFDQVSYNNNDTPDDGLSIYFSPNSNNEIDVEDAPKFANIDENLARLESNTLLSYENRAMPTDGEELSLFINQYRANNYVFEVEVGDFTGFNVFLKDNYTNNLHALEEGFNTVSFEIDPNLPGSLSNTRFSIVFDTTTLSNDVLSYENIKVFPNPAKDVLNVTLGINDVSFNEINLFDITGRWITNVRIDNSDKNHLKVDVSDLHPGIYMLKLQSGDKQFIEKIIVR